MARVLFIQNFWFEYLGIMVLSAVLKQSGHQVDLLVESKQENMDAFISRFNPDIIGMCVVSGSHNWAVETMKELKQRHRFVSILGGPHPTFFPEIVREEGIDAICIGEGEEAILELAEKVDNGEDYSGIRNLWVKSGGEIHRNPVRKLLQDLNHLPDPDRTLYYKYKILRSSPSKHFITGRGCPFNCTFCCNKAYKEIYQGLGQMVRRPEPEKVCREITSVKEKYPLKSVRFDDEVFLLQPDWLMVFLDRYRAEVGLPFSCLIRADLTTEPLVRAMKRAGCYIAYFGIESGNAHIRNDILGKNISKDQIIHTAYLLRKYGIKIGTFNMVGMPGETIENAWETVKLNRLIRADYPWCSIIQPYPGTDLARKAKAMGFLDENYGVNQLRQSYFNDSVIQNRDISKLVVLQKLFYIAVKYPSLDFLTEWLINAADTQFLARWLFNITFAYRYSKTYKMPFWEVLKRALLWRDSY